MSRLLRLLLPAIFGILVVTLLAGTSAGAEVGSTKQNQGEDFGSYRRAATIARM
jgi:hypothetical protein